MNNGFSLRAALTGNAIFSTISGLLMLSRPAVVESWLGINAAWLIQLIGVGLLLFASDLIHQATRKRMQTWRALYASTADLIWVVGTFVLLSAFSDAFSPLGIVLLIGVAAVVLAFGTWQFWAIAGVHRGSHGGKYRHCMVVDTGVSAEDLWRVIADFGHISRHTPLLANSYIEDNNQPTCGAVRTCEDTAGRRWSETCVQLEPGKSFTLEFNAEAKDFPYPASKMTGGWEVIPTSSGSRVMVWWELDPKPLWLGRVILPLLAFQVDRSVPKMVESMAADADTTVTTNARNPSGTLVRLVPRFC